MSGSLYPVAIDDVTSLPPPGPNTVTNAGTVTHAILHDNEILALQALETKLGTGSSTSTTSTVLRATSAGTSIWGKLVLTSDITGTLPVANGGTGITSLGSGIATFLGTPSSANLAAAVTDETGSGALVFGTSPAITTPTGIVKGDVGLGNVDNTSDTTKNAASVTLTNKTISGSSNTITNLGTSTLAANAVTAAKIDFTTFSLTDVLNGAGANTVATSQTTTSASFTDLGTVGPTNAVTIGASGKALVIITASFVGNSGGNYWLMGCAVSGATTVAANDTDAITYNMSTTEITLSRTILFTGLTAGSNTFTTKYRVTAGTGTWQKRNMVVLPL